MDSITSATAAAANSARPATTPETATAISSDFETFLQMLSTQLQNQDPMDPVKSEDFAVQLATFSGVEQQVLTNTLLQDLSSRMIASSMSDLASWVGLEARSAAPAAWSGTPVDVSINPLAAADRTILVVRNASGSEVHRAAVPITADTVSWDGRNAAGQVLPHGNYTFELENYAGDDLLATDPLESYALVTEARIMDGQTVLVTASGELVPSDLVTGLRQPEG
ncbi:hypothetical protein KUV28_04255 [Ferrimonas balearica]|nr:hypothetical protein [Ferrimonas balearica]